MERKRNLSTWRLGILVLLICLLTSLAVPALAEEVSVDPEPTCYEHGDANGDGSVDSRDAVYVLYHSFFGENPEYAVTQNCDFNKDGRLTSADAVYVLYSSFGGALEQTHPLDGTIHQYFSPVWNWMEDGTVEVTVKCGCGQTKMLTEADGLTVSMTKETPATCVDAGVVEYTASVTFEGNLYSDTKRILTPVTGHAMEGVQSCETASKCANCGYKLEPLGHDWVLDAQKSTAATCNTQAVQVYRCANADCGATNEITLEGFAEHSYTFERSEELEGCQRQEILKCSCGDEIAGEVYYEHIYTAVLTREANCQETGIKTFTCTCGDSYTETVPTNDSHSWVKGDTVDGITSYSCACGATKTAVCTEEDTASVSKDALAASSEVQIQDVVVSLDENVISNLGDTVEIQVTTTSVENLEIAEDAKNQIGSNPVYDITLQSDEEEISQLNGTATITVPYVLQEGDDVDCIDIWFIADDGTVTCVQGTYSNGYVTFTTTHFSYYTVTRLTPKQRCEAYGHAIGKLHVDATCTKEGFHKETCQRCGYVQADEVLKKVDHLYQETRTEPTCTEEGSFEKVCASCKETISGVLPALGHSWKLDENQSVKATCETAGKTVYVCGHDNCDATYAEEIPQLNHDFGDTEETKADCGSQGHKKRICKLCGYEYVTDKTAPTGHDYLEENVVWEWNEDYTGATATLVCSYNENHTKTLKAVISSKQEGNVCQGAGILTYTAEASFNKYTYTDSRTVNLEKAEHQPADTWQSTASGHSRKCKICGESVNTGSHVWGQETVVTEPTCSADGLAKQSCTVCGYNREVVLGATHDHNYVNGVCKDCGFEENSCGHIRTHKTPLDLSAYDVCDGTDIRWVSCDCGEVKYLYIQSMLCNMEYSEREETMPNGDTRYVNVSTCRDCGLVTEQSWHQELNQAVCTTAEVETLRVIFNGEQIASGRRVWTEGEGSGQHMMNIPGDTVDLSQYGDLCGVILEEYHCYCGEKSYIGIQENTCRWSYDDELSTDQMDVSQCSVCGALRKTTRSTPSKVENCTVRNTVKVSYEIDGQEIYSYTNQESWQEHNYQVVEKELDGDSCEDGVYVKKICRDCGKVHEEYSEYHIDVEWTETKLDGFCYEKVVQSVCACGTIKNFYTVSSGESRCNWEYIDDTTAVCTKCGLTRTREVTEGEKNENCESIRTTNTVYKDRDGKTVASGESCYTTVEHDTKTELELQGKTCEDGVKVTHTCKDCGYREQYTTKAHAQASTTYDLAEYGLCGGELRIYWCACGQEAGYSRINEKCEWEHVSGKKLETVEYCPGCGVTRTTTQTPWTSSGTCREKQTVTFTFAKDGNTLLEVTADRVRDNHREIYDLTLLGDSCEDGARVKSTCLDCGEVDSWTSYSKNHGTWPVERKWLSQGTLCGDLELVTYKCPCGMVTNYQPEWHNGECSFEGETWMGDDEGYVSTCSVCGVTRNEKHIRSGEIPGTCQYENVYHWTYSKNKTTLFSYEARNLQQSHEYIASFQLNGDTCADGFKVTETCFDCGYTRVRSYSEADCDRWFTTALEVLYDGENVCGPILKETSGCACGKNQRIEIRNWECQWEYLPSEENTERSICSECGLEEKREYTYNQAPGSCEVERSYVYTYLKDGVQLAKDAFSYTEMSHDTIATFEMMGDSCEDGYYVTQTCVRCGEEPWNRHFESGHGTWQTEYYDLTDYGMCDGEIWRYSCACGQESEWHYNHDCSWYSSEEDKATGLDKIYCAKCRTYRIWGSVGSAEPGSCDWKGTFYAKLTRDGETLLDLQKPVSRKEHQYVLGDVVLYDPELGCEGGYRAKLQCLYCDASYNTSGDYHDTHNVEYLYLADLYEDACGGGYFTLNRCACGERSNMDWSDLECDLSWNSDSYEGTDGYTHTVESRLCSDCGFGWTKDSFVVRTPGVCAQDCYSTITFSVHGQTLKTWTTKTVQYDHKTVRTYSLLPGSSDCADGLRVTETCQHCDYESSWNHSSGDYNHNNYNLDPETSIDLTEYGSVCGGTLAHYVCACGKQQRYDFSPDTLCDIDRVSVSHWIPGTIDTWQYTSQGQVWTDSSSYTLTCAVTDPDCDLKIRMSEYWLEKNCVATEYQTWQLGYDDLTGTCQYEFTIKTGDFHAYHPYEHSYTSTEMDDGTQRNSSIDFCPQCGSSYTVNTYQKNGSTVKREERAVNTLNNGENKSYIDMYEYGLEHAGYLYRTLENYEVIYADGSEYWYKNEYTYDFSGGCRRTRTYTNSDGEEAVYEEDAHIQSWEQETIKKPTCTQYGEYWEIYTCKVCQEEYQRNKYQRSPTAHSWSWNDEKQFYVCTVCGLENINGASGEIVLEDMTDAYGGNTNYVVGYWNRGGVDALRYVSVVLKDVAAGENDELVLTDIDFTYLTAKNDGITAISFSKDAVSTAAEKAVADAGYTGSYAIRFTFVPKYCEDTLDYAITFDHLDA